MSSATFDFQDRHVLVTGGTRGLGHTIARSFARSGARVTVTGTEWLSSSYRAPLSSFGYTRLDLTDHDSMVRVADELDTVDVLVHAAGARIPSTAGPQDHEFVRHSVNLGLVGPEQFTRLLRAPLGRSTMRGGASVILTHHMRSWLALAHDPEHAPREMDRRTRVLAARLAPEQIRVNCVASSVVVPAQAGTTTRTVADGPLLTRTQTQPTGTEVDLAESVMFLASASSAWVTGQTLMVHGHGAGGARVRR